MPKAGTSAFARLRAEAFGSLAALFILSITKEAAAVIAWFMWAGVRFGIFGADLGPAASFDGAGPFGTMCVFSAIFF